MRRIPLLALTLILAVALAAAGATLPGARAQSGASIHIIAIDADPAGNTATSLGPLNACVRAEPGAQVTVDLVVDAVPGPPAVYGIVAFEAYIDYAPDILEASAIDYEFLLGARGTFAPFEGLGDTTPDRDGRLYIAVADLATNDPSAGDNVEEGPGVLARITFTTKAAGLAAVAPVFEPPDIYPTVINNQNLTTNVETIAGAQIAVGQDCPVPPAAISVPQPIPPYNEAFTTPSPTLPPGATQPPESSETPAAGAPSRSPSPRPSNPGTATPDDPDVAVDEGDGGTSTLTVIAVAALALAGTGLAGTGGLILYRRRSQGG